jgi:hypothetical protein
MDQFPDSWSNTCFKYELMLEPEEFFHQADHISDEDIFWITITAGYRKDTVTENPWGWLTRPYIWHDGAQGVVLNESLTEETFLSPGQFTPVQGSSLCSIRQPDETYDLCFELLTDHPWVKWDQPFTGIRDWPHYDDQASFAVEDQFGDIQIQRRLTDDWLCTRMDPVVAISWYGSYIGYGIEACKCDLSAQLRRPDYFRLNLRRRTDTPGPSGSFSELVWDYLAFDYDEVLVGYDRNPQGEPNEPVFRYSIRLPEDAWYYQEGIDQVHSLGITAVYEASLDEIEYPWGRTNHPHRFGDTTYSITYTDEEAVVEPFYDHTGEPVDMSFTLYTVPEP